MSSKIIPIEQAIEMRNEYKTNINPLIENFRGGTYKPTEFAWIDLASIKEYIALLEEVQLQNNETVSGVRIYFSAYPNKTKFDFNNDSIDYPGRESVFLVPTIKVKSSSDSVSYPNLENVPFCINPVNQAFPLKGDFQVINDLLNSKDCSTGNGTTSYTNKTSLVLNRLGLTPPPE